MLRDKRLTEFDINTLELKINELIESVSVLQSDEEDEEGEEKSAT